MQKLHKFLISILALLFAMIIVGPMGDLLYDQVYKSPAPKIIEFLRIHSSWIIGIFAVLLIVTIWTWFEQKEQQKLKKEGLDLKEFYLIKFVQELCPEDLNFRVKKNGEIVDLICRPYNDTYIPRKAIIHTTTDYLDSQCTFTEAELISLLKKGTGIIFLGQPLEGKSRTVFEILKRMDDYIVIRPFRDRLVPPKDSFAHLSGVKVILLLEDLNEYIGTQADLFEYGRRLSQANVNWVPIATCRDGPELAALKDANGQGLNRLYDSIAYKLSLVPATVEEKGVVAKSVGKRWDEYSDKLFPNLGSITMAEPIQFMRERFKSLPNEQKDVLRAIKLLTNCGVSSTQERVQAVLRQVSKRDAVIITENLEELANQAFICRPASQDPILAEAAYILGAVTYPDGKTLKDTLPLLADALTEINDVGGLINLGQSNTGMLGDHRFALDCYERAFCLQSFTSDDWSKKGIAYLWIRRFEDALQAFEEQIKIDSTDSNGWSNKAICLSMLKHLEEALIAIEKALSIDPYDDHLQFNKASILIKLGRVEDAFELIEEVIKKRPVDTQFLYNRGLALRRLDRITEALDTFSLILRINPDYAEARAFKGELLITMGHFDEALKSYEELIKLRPDYPGAWSNKGVALAKLDRNEEALAAFQKAVSLEPNTEMYWLNSIAALRKVEAYQALVNAADEALKVWPKSSKLLFEKGIALEKLELYQEALNVYEQVIKVDSRNHLALLRKGIMLEHLQRVQEALKAYNRALRIKPCNRDAQFMKGIKLYTIERYDDALKTFEIAYNCNHSDPEAWFIGEEGVWLTSNEDILLMKGLVLDAQGSYTEAISSFDEVLHENPKNASALSYKGMTLIKVNSLKEGLSCLDQAHKIDPNNLDVLKNKAIGLLKAGRKRKAVKSLNAYLVHKEDDAEAWFLKGSVFLDSNNSKVAAACFAESVRLDPNNFSAWINLGVALGQLGEYEDALGCFINAEKLKPGDRAVWSNTALLLRLWGKYDAALSILDSVLKISPDDIRALYEKAELLALTGQKEEAAKVLFGLLKGKHKLAKTMAINVRLKLFKLGYRAKDIA